MASYALLDQAEEDALHKSRLLNVEEKTFKRITKRLLAPNSPITLPPTLPPTPPPDASTAAQDTSKQQQLEERRQWREDTLLDFAAFESSIIRIQFLLTSNHKERERYKDEKLKIEATAQAVRDNTADLRVQLEEAQRTLALRKEYDDLAEKIYSKPVLQSREDQHANLAKLNAEIADLQRESEEYAETWSQRRHQFARMVEEGMRLRRMIRDEKDEVEQGERTEIGEDAEDDGRGRSSGINTPRSATGGTTPMHPTSQEHDVGTPSGLGAELQRSSRGRSPLSNSQIITEYEEKKTPMQQEEVDDEEMAEDGELAAEAEGVVAAPVEGLVARDVEQESKKAGEMDQMDTT